MTTSWGREFSDPLVLSQARSCADSCHPVVLRVLDRLGAPWGWRLTRTACRRQAAAMSSPVPAPDPANRAPKRKLPIIPLAGMMVVVLAVAVLIVRGVDVRGLLTRGLAIIRDLGPAVFFLAMTILPAFGMPMLAFTITAGEAFESKLGLPAVIAISLVSVAVNLALGYWVARYALRPLLARLITRYGYSVPRVTRENALTITMLVRLTPGPPYALQAVLLGLAEVPFKIYMLVSWLAMVPLTIGAIVLGQGVFSGKFGRAATGLGVLIAGAVAVQLIRQKLARRKAAASAAVVDATTPAD